MIDNGMINGRYLIEEYRNGDSWYRIYSDGFVEQGGLANTRQTVNFLKAFANTNYTILGNEKLATTTNPWANTGFKAMSCTVSSFYCYLSNTNTQNNIETTVSWYACGMGA